jgi:SfnB family sulfur acquisition oxidoreductase
MSVSAGIAVIASDEEAIEAANRIAADLRPGAVDRDRERAIPRRELKLVDESGLLGITIPPEDGGAGVSVETLVEVFRILAAADPSISQTLLPHYVVLGAALGLGAPSLRASLVGDVLGGSRIGNGISERGTKHAWDPQTTAVLDGDEVVVTGRKYYATGSLTAGWLGVAAKDESGNVILVMVPRDAEGLEVSDEWTSFGQRSTISGPAVLEGVRVSADNLLALWKAFEGPFAGGAFDQLLHTAIDVGIARGALDDGGEFVRTKARAWFEGGFERPTEEPEVVYRFGQLAARVSIAEAALRQAAQRYDEVTAEPLTDASTAALSIEVASIKVFAAEVAVETASGIFELAGTSGTDAAVGLDRHWRNARTHTLHDPVRWKFRHIGNYALNDEPPPRHPLI